MDFIEKLKTALPKEINFDDLYELVPADLWKTDPRKASVIALEKSNVFDSEAYLKRYKDVRDAGVDPIQHYVNYGIDERRLFYRKNKYAVLFSISNSYAFALCNALMSLGQNSPKCVENCDIIIYSDDLTDNNKNVIKKINSNCQFYKIKTSENNEDFIKNHTLPKFFLEYPAVKTRWGICNLFKLAAYTFLEDYEKILILDADIYIKLNIYRIFNFEKPYAWRPVRGRNALDILKECDLYEDEKEITYCNGGVILISKYILNYCTIPESFHLFKKITRDKNIRLIDEIIHIWIAYKYNIPIEILSSKWNDFDNKRFDDLKIVHFMGAKRFPWNNYETQSLLPEWMENCKKIIELGIDDFPIIIK